MFATQFSFFIYEILNLYYFLFMKFKIFFFSMKSKINFLDETLDQLFRISNKIYFNIVQKCMFLSNFFKTFK